MAYLRATGRRADDVHILDNVARLIASRTRIFSRESGDTAMLMPDELHEGTFQEGGASLRFNEPGRAPIRDLVILLDDLEKLVEEVRRLYTRVGE